MKTIKTLGLLVLVVLVAGSSGCERTNPDPECYEGEVISLMHCDHVIQIKNADLGVAWSSEDQSYDNCVVVANLPDEYKIVGQKVYFSKYEDTQINCTTIWAYVKPIKATNISNLKCNENNEN